MIRRLSINDVIQLSELGESSFRDTYSWYNSQENMNEYVAKNFNRHALNRELVNENIIYFGIENENNLLSAYAKFVLGKNSNGQKKSTCAELARIYVDKKYFGKGQGKILLEFCANFLKENNISSIWLGVWQKNKKAIAFYERMGFKKKGTTTFLLGTDLQDDFIYELNLA